MSGSLLSVQMNQSHPRRTHSDSACTGWRQPPARLQQWLRLPGQSTGRCHWQPQYLKGEKRVPSQQHTKKRSAWCWLEWAEGWSEAGEVKLETLMWRSITEFKIWVLELTQEVMNPLINLPSFFLFHVSFSTGRNSPSLTAQRRWGGPT